MRSRGIIDNAIFSDFTIGYSNGTLLNTIPDEGAIREALKEIGILNEKGHEMFYGCAVFPIFDENKDAVGIYGRRITAGETAHLYLPVPAAVSSTSRRRSAPSRSSSPNRSSTLSPSTTRASVTCSHATA